MWRNALLLTLPLALSPQPTAFQAHVLADDLKGGYQVTAADINGDGKTDLIALAQYMDQLFWFENPGWKRHVLATGLRDMINCEVVEPGREIIIASGFNSQASRSEGIVSVLRAGTDVRQPWTATEIDRLSTAHRLRLARIDRGRPVVVNAPLTSAKAQAPDYREPTPLVYYRPGEWKRVVISEEVVGVEHGILVTDWDADGLDDILTASFAGIHVYSPDAGKWKRVPVAAGDPAAWPKSGSSDLALGRLGKTRFLAAIEPWHGNQVAVYRQVEGKWARQVIDESFAMGHALTTADLNGDGRDEIVAGYRTRGNTYIYTAGGSGEQWTRTTLEEGMASASCAAADLNNDGRVDIACIDGTRLKWYENRGLK